MDSIETSSFMIFDTKPFSSVCSLNKVIGMTGLIMMLMWNLLCDLTELSVVWLQKFFIPNKPNISLLQTMQALCEIGMCLLKCNTGN